MLERDGRKAQILDQDEPQIGGQATSKSLKNAARGGRPRLGIVRPHVC